MAVTGIDLNTSELRGHATEVSNNMNVEFDSPRSVMIVDINIAMNIRRNKVEIGGVAANRLSLKKSHSVDCRVEVDGIRHQQIAISMRKEIQASPNKSIERSKSEGNLNISFVESIKSLRDSWKVCERNRRLSKSLVLLRQAQIDIELSRSIESRKSRTKKRKILGDLGLALFNPLDGVFGYDDDDFDAVEPEPNLVMNTSDLTSDDSVDSDPMQPIIIVKECLEVVLENPYILPLDLMQKIADEALPMTLEGMAWKRIYSLNRDGDSFQTFLRNVERQANTLIVVRTMKNEIFGSFADSAWEEPRCTKKKHYYGIGGRSFLFSVNEKSLENKLNVYRWTGENNYNQICNASQQRIAMGGGENGFGLCLEDNFARGSTEHCATYCNDPLVSGGYFDIVELEVFGFTYPWNL